MMEYNTRYFHAILLFFMLLTPKAYSQDISVERILVNSSLKNDFAPYVIDSVLYFSSNRKHELLKTYVNKNNEWVYRLYQSSILPNNVMAKENLVQKDQLSKLNTPTIAWSQDQSVIVITQNQYTNIKNSKGRENLLGIYIITNQNGKWSRPVPFPHNSRRAYSNVHPTITPDGNTIYFASDMPGGLGKSDIYESTRENGEWSIPVNLGKVINTEGSEVFPYYHPSGKLYFSSEGHNSSGKLDIFYTSKNGSRWSDPVKLEYPINSESNDFSCFIYPSQNEGYFASDRMGQSDIYKFTISNPSFPDAQPQVTDEFCFTFFENGEFVSDTLPYKYKWLFGDGKSASGLEVDHCFPGPGTYNVALNVVDTLANVDLYTVANYLVELEAIQQIVITAPDTAKVGAKVYLSADKSVLKDFIPQQYYWCLGDGNRDKGISIDYVFSKEGIYTITCGAISEMDTKDKMGSTVQIVVIE